jgi:hypothetical protein
MPRQSMRSDCGLVGKRLLRGLPFAINNQSQGPTCCAKGHDIETGMRIQVVSAAAGDALTTR